MSLYPAAWKILEISSSGESSRAYKKPGARRHCLPATFTFYPEFLGKPFALSPRSGFARESSQGWISDAGPSARWSGCFVGGIVRGWAYRPLPMSSKLFARHGVDSDPDGDQRRARDGARWYAQIMADTIGP